MARYRLSRPAQSDIVNILAMSAKRWGDEGRHRYSAMLAAAMRKAALNPDGHVTRDRADLLPGLRSLHLRHVRGEANTKVRNPVHVLYYRPVEPGLIEIVRVLHERMEPGLHLL